MCFCFVLFCFVFHVCMFQWHAQRGARGAQPPPFLSVIQGILSTFVSHSREKSSSPAPYTSNQTAFGGIEKNLPPPPCFPCACHWYVPLGIGVFDVLLLANSSA